MLWFDSETTQSVVFISWFDVLAAGDLAAAGGRFPAAGGGSGGGWEASLSKGAGCSLPLQGRRERHAG